MKMIRNNKVDDFTIDSYKNELIIRERPCNDADSTKPATANSTNRLERNSNSILAQGTGATIFSDVNIAGLDKENPSFTDTLK